MVFLPRKRKISKRKKGRERVIARAEKIAGSLDRMKQVAAPIFRAAVNFMDFDPSQRYIFIGQKMRPFFEAVWQINLIEKRVPKRNLVYYVAPRGKWESIDVPEKIAFIRKRLQEKRIVSAKQQNYAIIDYFHAGRTFRALEVAIQSLNSKAKVIGVFQHNRLVGLAIHDSQVSLMAPTSKTPSGDVHYLEEWSWDRANFLLFKAALYDFIRKYKKQGKQKRGKN